MKQSAEDWTRATIVPGAGDGTLARIGPVVLLVGSTDPDVVRPYVDHAQMVAANGGQGRQLVRGYALMLSTAVEQSPGFAALAPHATGLAVFVDGDVVVTVGDERISGADSLAWVERLIPWPVDEVSVTLPGASPADAGSTYRLDGGVIQAGALVVPAGAPTSASIDGARHGRHHGRACRRAVRGRRGRWVDQRDVARARCRRAGGVARDAGCSGCAGLAPAAPARRPLRRTPGRPPAPEPAMADDHAGHDHAGTSTRTRPPLLRAARCRRRRSTSTSVSSRCSSATSTTTSSSRCRWSTTRA